MGTIRYIFFLLFCIFQFLISCKESLTPVTPTIFKDDSPINIKDSLIDLKIEKSYIFRSGLYGYQYGYGDLARLDNGTLMITCMRSKVIGDFNSGNIITSYSFDDGKTWSKPIQIEHQIDDSNYINISHPSLLNLSNGHLMLFFLVKYSTTRIDIRFKESFDNGKTWQPDKIVYGKNQGYQILNNARVVFSNHRIFIPISIPKEKNDTIINMNNLSIFYYYSEDLGVSWSKSKVLTNNIGLLEPNITQVSNREFLMNIRTGSGKILFAKSNDNGTSWNFKNSLIKSPSSPQKIVRIANSDSLVMIWNNTDYNYAQFGGNRNPLSIALSTDKGNSWNYLGNIEDTGTRPADYSYPSILIDNHYFHITYYDTWGGFSLKYAKIPRFDKSLSMNNPPTTDY